MHSSSSRPARTTSRSERSCFATPTRRSGYAPSSPSRSPRWAFATSTKHAESHTTEASRHNVRTLRAWAIDPACRCVRLARSVASTTKTPPGQAPARSRDQRMEALKRANDIRVRRAKLKKDLKEGRVNIETILNSPPEYVSTAKVFDILMAVPKFGRVKAARFLNQCRISQSKTVGGVSERQRAGLVCRFARN